jgi:hypothetical protein
MPIDVPRQLIERLNRGEVVLFVGDALDDEVPISKQLAGALVEECGAYCDFCSDEGPCLLPHSCKADLNLAAQMYEREAGPSSLRSFVRDFLKTQKVQTPSRAHHLIASLPVKVIISTSYDDRLLKALNDSGRDINHVFNDNHIPYFNEDMVQIIRLRGTIAVLIQW